MRESIMNDLYNDLSSSDEEDDSPAPQSSQKEEKKEESKTGNSEEQEPAKVSPEKKKPGYDKEQILKDIENLEKKKIAKEANEALKELYGDDYEQPGQQ